MDLTLQLWAGVFYLTNKILFSLAEGKSAELKRTMKTAGWVVYLLGVPAWVILLVGKHNWIAASIEAGGIPAMLLGLYNALYGHNAAKWFYNHLVSFLTYAFIVFGISYSFYEFGGIKTLSQGFELAVMVGFLLGGYFLARGNLKGWLFFMLMNLSMGSLMLLQGKTLLAVQQMISLVFVVYGFVSALS
ncbi:MAG: hypothetical protein P8X74_15295 [Reinekea sp.]|jgi:hypothetical protein